MAQPLTVTDLAKELVMVMDELNGLLALTEETSLQMEAELARCEQEVARLQEAVKDGEPGAVEELADVSKWAAQLGKEYEALQESVTGLTLGAKGMQKKRKEPAVAKVVTGRPFTFRKQQPPQKPQKWVTVQGKRIPITQGGPPQQGGKQQAPATAPQTQPAQAPAQQVPQAAPAQPAAPPQPRKIGVVKAPSLEAAKATVKKLTDLLDPSLEVAGAAWEPREHTKERIAKTLADRLRGDKEWEALVGVLCESELGITYGGGGDYQRIEEKATGALVSAWAHTAGDGDALSVTMQRAAKDEFGLSDAVLDHLGALSSYSERSLQPGFAGMKRFLRAMYDETQEWLSANGLDSVALFRGAGVEKGFAKSGEVAEVQLQPMSSFSASPEMALTFCGMADGDESAVLYAAVPRERILGTCQSGYGCREETEMVVLGGSTQMMVAGLTSELRARLPARDLPISESWTKRSVNEVILPAIVEQGGPENAQP